MRRSINESSLIVTANPKSPIAEVYRALRTNIQYSSSDFALKTIMVTSAQASEGKTTTISNLAVAYAQEGKKTLLIDCDMRKPSLHHMFSIPNRNGLSKLLSGEAKLQEVLCETIIENLSLIPSGPIPTNPSELINSALMKELLESLKDHYDVILIDTPPVLAVTDSIITSALCDGVIMVAAAGKVKKEYLKKAKERLDHVNASILGVVLNQINRDDYPVFYMEYYGMKSK